MNSERFTAVSTRAPLPHAVSSRLSLEARECVERLLAHDEVPLPDFGQVKRAAVLVALFERPAPEGQGESVGLEVVLTTRAKHLRRQPSQTALPGGRVDDDDESMYHTARREAFEEVHLPLDDPSIIYLATLEPVITVLPLGSHYHNHIAVVPVVCLLSDPSLVDALHASPDEVDHVFTHPLRAVLDGRPAEGAQGEEIVRRLQPVGGEWWPHPEEFHRFRTCQSPIKGLTSDILIHTATIAYVRPPSYARYAPGQPPFPALLAEVVAALPGVLAQDERDALAGVVREREEVMWGAMDGGEGVRSGEVWAQA